MQNVAIAHVATPSGNDRIPATLINLPRMAGTIALPKIAPRITYVSTVAALGSTFVSHVSATGKIGAAHRPTIAKPSGA